MKTLAIINSTGIVHNWSNANCPPVKRVRELEILTGRTLHHVVNAKQVFVFGLGGCRDCWGSPADFKKIVEVL